MARHLFWKNLAAPVVLAAVLPVANGTWQVSSRAETQAISLVSVQVTLPRLPFAYQEGLLGRALSSQVVPLFTAEEPKPSAQVTKPAHQN